MVGRLPPLVDQQQLDAGLERRLLHRVLELLGGDAGAAARGDEEAARREVREETGAEVEIDGMVGLFSYPGRPVAVAVYRARMAPGSPPPRPADETLEVGWFDADEVEGLALAFRSTAEALGRLFGRSYGFSPGSAAGTS